MPLPIVIWGSFKSELPKLVLVMAAVAATTESLPAPPSTHHDVVVGSARQAAGLIDAVERARRLAAVAAVDALTAIDASRVYYEHGHASARVMFAHEAAVSSAEAFRLDKIRRMIAEAELIAHEWRAGGLSVDAAVLLGRAFANPRTRRRFLDDQRWFIKRARRFSFVKLKRLVARWIEVHDQDGSQPPVDPSFDNRYARLVQDHFAKAWRLEASLGSLQGSFFHEVLRAYVKAEFSKDWTEAEQIHGAAVCVDLLARTHSQRMADALCQIATDAVNSDRPSAPVKRVHNIVWSAESYEELVSRWAGARPRPLDADTYRITDLDGHPVDAATAFADSLVSSVRRVVQNAAGVTINLSKPTRLFTGLARLGVQLSATECYWPGCWVPSSQCHVDHLKPAARGGLTEQHNGLPACPRHNWLKETGYTVARARDGTVTITTPVGDTLVSDELSHAVP